MILDVRRDRRASTGSAKLHFSMRRPKLPGSEKFKFSCLSTLQQTSTSASSASLDSSASCSRASSIDQDIHKRFSTISLNRSDTKKKAVLPITSKSTFRLLSNAEIHVNGNVEVRDETRKRFSRDSMDSIALHPSSVESSPESLGGSKSSLDAPSHRKSSLEDFASNLDWKNIRANPSRLSASIESSCSSDESDIWVLRENSQR